MPRGDTLPDDDWKRRHQGILVLLCAQIVGLLLFAIAKRIEPAHLSLEMAALAVITGVAALPALTRRWRGALASVGLITCSALLTHFSGGYIEAHFHFFVMLGVIVLYEDWVTYLLSIGYVAVHHGTVGTIDPRSVYNHAAAFGDPWLWAGVHAAFVLWLSAALVVYWRTSERLRSRSELVLRSSGAGLVGINRIGRITFANPAVATMSQQPAETWIGRPFTDLVSAPKLGSWATVPVAQQAEGTLVATGGPKPVEISLTPAMSHGEVVGHVASLTDISERKQAEQALRRFNDELEVRVRQRTHELEEALREIEAFSYSVSHDLRSPLRVVRGFSEMLLEDLSSSLDPERRAQLEHVYKASERMDRTIESLLRLSRISRAAIRRQRVDISSMCNFIVDQLRAEEPDRNVKITIEAGVFVDADIDLARVVLSNLVGNAWKFTRERPDPRIEVGTVLEGNRRTLVVHDNGAGFRQEDAHDMFQPFKRFHDPGRFEGTGIGLATVARILKRHGGFIHARGSPDLGATFLFSFGEPSPKDVTKSSSNGSTPHVAAVRAAGER